MHSSLFLVLIFDIMIISLILVLRRLRLVILSVGLTMILSWEMELAM